MISNNNVSKKDSTISTSLVMLMSVACGITVANIYYAQPLLSEIAKFFRVSEGSIGMVAMLTQIGYAAGMFFLLPLGDIKERRSLIVFMLFVAAVALILMSIAFNMGILLFAAFAVGFTSIVPQLIVPFAAHLASPKERGKVIGNVMSGLLIGILASRTFSGIIGAAFGWRVVYVIAAIMMILLAALLKILLPISEPTSEVSYGNLLTSMWGLLKSEAVLREASSTGAMMFATFSVFWTSLIFLLESPAYHLGAQAAGLFGLVGVTGALAAPIVGQIADKKSPRFTVGIAIIISTLAYICFWALGLKLWGLIIGVILLDLGTQSGQVSNQARIHALNPEARNRINTVFMVFYFIGGSIGSILGAYSWTHFGWTGVCVVGLLFQLVAIILHFAKGMCLR
jgi:predicted MFS family arabinose efflux permease